MQHQSPQRRLLLEKLLSHTGGHEISWLSWNSKRSTAKFTKAYCLTLYWTNFINFSQTVSWKSTLIYSSNPWTL